MNNSDIIKTLETADEAPDNPFTLFGVWLKDAENTENHYPNAMSLATVDPDGQPSVRIVLMRHYDEDGFVFYTNSLSRKGKAMEAHPVAGLNFWWKTLERQVRIEGPVEPVDEKMSDDYFARRPRGSRIGAWASRQSEPLQSRSALKNRIAELEQKYEGKDIIPRPPHWYGYRVKPALIEFWHEGQFRLHTRMVYTKAGDGWDKQMLFP